MKTTYPSTARPNVRTRGAHASLHDIASYCETQFAWRSAPKVRKDLIPRTFIDACVHRGIYDLDDIGRELLAVLRKKDCGAWWLFIAHLIILIETGTADGFDSSDVSVLKRIAPFAGRIARGELTNEHMSRLYTHPMR